MHPSMEPKTMSLYWLRPEWTEALCAHCGQNIYASGGDPDWGLCWPCMEHQNNLAQAEREYEQERSIQNERESDASKS